MGGCLGLIFDMLEAVKLEHGKRMTSAGVPFILFYTEGMRILMIQLSGFRYTLNPKPIGLLEPKTPTFEGRLYDLQILP